jgi:hypothetical protein
MVSGHQLEDARMATDRVRALEALLVEAESAHAVYETTELNGVYDEQWPAWYAAYAVEHGIGEVIGRPVTSEELGRFLEAAWADYERAGATSPEPWSTVIARRIAEEL